MVLHGRKRIFLGLTTNFLLAKNKLSKQVCGSSAFRPKENKTKMTKAPEKNPEIEFHKIQKNTVMSHMLLQGLVCL